MQVLGEHRVRRTDPRGMGSGSGKFAATAIGVEASTFMTLRIALASWSSFSAALSIDGSSVGGGSIRTPALPFSARRLWRLSKRRTMPESNRRSISSESSAMPA